MPQFYYKYEKSSIRLEQYVYRIGSYHYNWHKDIELLVVIRGIVEVCADGCVAVLESGDVLLINSNKGHATLSKKPGSIAMLVHLAPESLMEYYGDMEYLHFSCISNIQNRYQPAFVMLRASMADMLLSQYGQTPESKLLFESALYALLHTIALYFPPVKTPRIGAQQLKKRMDAIEHMVRFIDKNYKKRITLDHLAKVAQYNRNYVSQLFKSCMGINFHDYLTRVRLREATIALKSDSTIAEIALANGFADVKAFNENFRAMFGKAPTEYRRQLSGDIIREDVSFKKEFLPFDDEEVNQLLRQYSLEGNACRRDGLIHLPQTDQTTAERLTVKLRDAASALEEIAARLKDAARLQ